VKWNLVSNCKCLWRTGKARTFKYVLLILLRTLPTWLWGIGRTCWLKKIAWEPCSGRNSSHCWVASHWCSIWGRLVSIHANILVKWCHNKAQVKDSWPLKPNQTQGLLGQFDILIWTKIHLKVVALGTDFTSRSDLLGWCNILGFFFGSNGV
jgi:hypothetical protein